MLFFCSCGSHGVNGAAGGEVYRLAKKYIREEILNTARRMFNQKGCAAVSMRDIADALGISVGNLTYHFNRKEDIVEAVAEETCRYELQLPTPATLPELNAVLARMQNNIRQNAFYFWHGANGAGLPPGAVKIQTGLLRRQYELLLEAFQNLERIGMMQKEPGRGRYRQLAQVLQLLCIYWEPQNRLEAELDTPKDFLNCAWSILLPHLTREGVENYHEKVMRVRMEFE